MANIRDHFEETRRQLDTESALKIVSKQFGDPKAPRRMISGIAVSSFEKNANGQAFHTAGMQCRLPLPLLADHDFSYPLGRVVGVEVRGAAVHFKAEVVDVPWMESLWLDVIIRSLVGISMGPTNLAEKSLDGRFYQWRLDEISVVRTGADPGARIDRCWERLPYLSLKGPNEITRWQRNASGEIIRGAVAWPGAC